jgi:hypothetical protein
VVIRGNDVRWGLRVEAEKCREDLHDGPVEVLGIAGDLLQGVDTAEPDRQVGGLRVSELFDRLGKTVGHLAAAGQLQRVEVLAAAGQEVGNPHKTSDEKCDDAQRTDQVAARVALCLRDVRKGWRGDRRCGRDRRTGDGGYEEGWENEQSEVEQAGRPNRHNGDEEPDFPPVPPWFLPS